MEREDNRTSSIELAGMVTGIKTRCNKSNPDNVDIFMNLTTGKIEKNASEESNKCTMINQMTHRVAWFNVPAEKAKTWADLEKTFSQESDAFLKTPHFASLEGHLVNAMTDSPYVRTECIESLGKKIKSSNRAILSGEIMEVRTNSAYAMALLQVCHKTEKGTEETTEIPVMVFSGNKEYKKLCEKKIAEGDSINVKGKLKSSIFRNGNIKVFRCSIDSEKFTLNKKMQEKATQQVSI